MAIAYESSASANSNTSPLTITKPSGVAAGDLLIAFVSMNGGSASFVAPAGWDSYGTATNGSNRTSNCFARVATAADVSATDYSFTNADSPAEFTGSIFRFSGDFNSTDSIVDSDATASDNGTFTGGVTPNNGGALFFAASNLTTATSDPEYSGWAVATDDPTWTEIVDRRYDTTFKMGAAWATRASTNATGTYSVTLANDASGTDQSHGFLLTLEEAVNVNVSVGVQTLTASIQAPTVTGDAQVAAGVQTLTASIQAPTITTQTNDWNFEAKASDAVWTIESQN